MTYPVRSVVLPANLVGASNGKLVGDQLGTAYFEARGLLACHPQTSRAWNALFAACWWEQSVVLTSTSSADVYRTYNQQVAVFRARYTVTPVPGTHSIRTWNGQTWYLKQGMAQVATPGMSNHGLGLAIDVCEIRDGKDLVGIAGSPAWPWLLANALRFGLSWEAQSEPWHLHLFTGDTPTQAVLDFEAGQQLDPPPPPPELEHEPEHAPPTYDPIDGFPETADKPELVVGVQGEQALVLYMQVVLFYKGGGNIAMDGRFGKLTEGRVKDLQRLFRITADGRVGPNTWGIIDYLARN